MPEALENVIITHFGGGISNNTKSGPGGAFRMGRGLDLHSDSDSVSVLPRNLQDDGGVVTGLVKWMSDANPFTQSRFAYDDGGNIYSVTNGIWTKEHTIPTAQVARGQGLGTLSDTLFAAADKTIAIKQYLSLGGTYTDDFFTDGTNNVDVIQIASGSNYNILPTLSENAVDKIALTANSALALTRDPMRSLVLTLSSKGSGDVTVALHDNKNQLITSKTITNASLVNGDNTFTFPIDARIVLGNSYHIHVTATTSDVQVKTGIVGNLNTANFATLFGILISSPYHPIMQHINGVTGIIAIGNDRYIATYDMSTFLPNKIVLEPGYSIRAFSKYQEYLVAWAWRNTSNKSSEYGRAYYWDGVSSYFNYYDEITNGLPNAVVNFKNRIFSVLGSNGGIDIETQPFRLIQPAPKLSSGASVEVQPGAISVWNKKVYMGMANTDDTQGGVYKSGANDGQQGVTQSVTLGFEPGIYEFGNQSDRKVDYQSIATEVLNYAWTPSSGVLNPTSFEIGAVAPFGSDLYFAWRDGGSYGVDRVNKANGPSLNASYESLIIDLGINDQQLASMPMKYKSAKVLVVNCAPLPAGVSLTPKYRADRATKWTYGTTIGVNATQSQLNYATIGAMRYREMEVGFDITCLTSTTGFPVVTAVYFEFDPLTGESNYNSL